MRKNKLLTVANFAKKQGVTKQGVYRKIKDKTIAYKEIDGVKFIKVPL